VAALDPARCLRLVIAVAASVELVGGRLSRCRLRLDSKVAIFGDEVCRRLIAGMLAAGERQQWQHQDG
jgi:hypothetical protein